MKGLLLIVVVIGVIIYFRPEWIEEVIEYFSEGEFFTETLTASEVDCDKLASQWTGESLSNAFGAETKILKLYDVKKESRSENKLSCLADVMFDRGEGDQVRLTYEKDRDGEWWSKAEVVRD